MDPLADLWGWETAIKTLAMLSIVLGAVVLFLFLIKRLTLRSGYGQSGIKILSSCYIAPRKQILLIDVMGERLVLGVTAERITCLAKLEKCESSQQFEIENINDSGDRFFSKLFKPSTQKNVNQNGENEPDQKQTT